MSTDDPNPSDLPPAVRETLDSLGGALGDIAELDKEQLNETIGLLETLGHDQAAGILRSRREVLKGAGAATGLGIAGLAGATATGGARAQSDTQTGSIGNGNQDADLQDVSAESVNADEQNNTPYAGKFDGASLADRIQAAIDAGAGGVRVARQSGAYDWFTEVSPPQNFDILFDDFYQPVNFVGSAQSGDADIAIKPARRLTLRGGNYTSARSAWEPADPWRFVQPQGAMTDSDIDVAELRNFEFGIDLIGAGAVAWNDIRVRRAAENYRAVHFDVSGGYTNENRIRLDHAFYPSNGLSTGDEITVYNENGGDNSIYNSDIGAADGTMIRIDEGGGLRLHNCRMEDTTGSSTFFDTSNFSGVNAAKVYGHNQRYVNIASKSTLASESDIQFFGIDEQAIKAPGVSGQLGGTNFGRGRRTGADVSAIGTFDPYVFIRDLRTEPFSKTVTVSVNAYNSADGEEYAALKSYLYASGAGESVSTLHETTTGGTMSIQRAGDNIEAKADSASGWTSKPDDVTVSVRVDGVGVDVEDETP